MAAEETEYKFFLTKTNFEKPHVTGRDTANLPPVVPKRRSSPLVYG